MKRSTQLYTEHLVLWVTPEQKQHLFQAAARQQIKAVQYLRQLITNDIHRQEREWRTADEG
jgi:hypothetical protein